MKTKLMTTIIAMAMVLMIGSCFASVEALSDSTGDVYHWDYVGSVGSWDTDIGNKPNIDITEVSYTVDGDHVTLTLKVAGTIVDSELISYWAYINTSDSNYMVSWTNGEGIGFGTNTEEGSYDMDFEPTITVEGNTLSATYNLVGTLSTGVETWGWTAEYTSVGDMASEWWADWAPDDYALYDGEDAGDDGSGSSDDTTQGTDGAGSGSTDEGASGGTPGFEVVGLLAALGIAFVVLRRRL